MAIAQRTRKILWTRAADRCAICRCKLTKDPRHSNDREAVLGMECHIVARGKGGPRSGSAKPRDLDDYRNLILLCPTHHKEVDDQPAEYTIEKLRELKREHEEWVDETLEWRATLPEAFWRKVKEEAEELLLTQVGEVDEETADLLEHLGIFSLLTAELLGAPELTFFTRGEKAKVTLGFKYQEGAVLFAFAEEGGLQQGFDAFDQAAVIENYTDEVTGYQEKEESNGVAGEREDEYNMFRLAGLTLRRIARQISSAEAVFYVRGAPPKEGPELAFRVLDDEVFFAGGEAGTFAAAHEAFANHDPVDASHAVRARMFFDKYSGAIKRNDPRERIGFIANSFAISIIDALGYLPSEEAAGDEQKAVFARLARNRFYEALLMLRAADLALDHPRIRAWAEEHADPQPKDGLSAVLPTACREVVREYVQEMELDEEDEAELEEDALDSLFTAIDRFHRFDEDEEVQEALATLTLERLEWWDDPEARAEIIEMADIADAMKD